MPAKTIIDKPHDKIFKLALSDRRAAIEFFKKYLPPEILAKIDLSTLELVNAAFINVLFKNSDADILYRVKFKGKNKFLYLHCEQQSTVEQYMAIRLRFYQTFIMEYHLKQFPGQDVPLIYSMIYYTGENHWGAPLEIYSFFGEHQDLAREWALKPCQLIELKNIPDQEIRQNRYWGLAEYALKHHRNPNLKEFLQVMLPWIEEVAQDPPQGYTLAKNVLKYVLNGIEGKEKDAKTFEEAVKTYSQTLGAETMTLAEAFTKRGHDRGLQEGVSQGEVAMLLRQLKHRFYDVPANYLKKIQQADSETLLLWGEKILDAETLEEVFV